MYTRLCTSICLLLFSYLHSGSMMNHLKYVSDDKKCKHSSKSSSYIAAYNHILTFSVSRCLFCAGHGLSGDHVQIPICFWRSGEDSAASDWCCDPDAGESDRPHLVIWHHVLPRWAHGAVCDQMAVDQAQRQNLHSLFLSGGGVESVNPCLILIVRRENVVGDSMEVLRKSKNVDYKKPLKVNELVSICSSLVLLWRVLIVLFCRWSSSERRP